MPMTDDVDTQIRALMTELAEAAPPAPSLSELEMRDALDTASPEQFRWWASLERGRLTLVGGIAAVVAAVLLPVLLLPSVGQHEPVAATLS